MLAKNNTNFVCFVTFLFLGIYVSICFAEECKPKLYNPIGQRCQPSCVSDANCIRQNKKCLCDGDCGLSCIDTNKMCHPRPSKMAHGVVRVSPKELKYKYKFNSVAVYECNQRYTLVGRSIRVCQGDGRWKGQAPRCEANHGSISENQKDCDPPPRVHHATHDADGYRTRFEQGVQVAYECEPGYTLNGVHKAWCVDGGVWVGPTMNCTTSKCSRPESIQYGTVNHMGMSDNTPGSRVMYSCNKDYYIIGDEVRTCQKDGTWSGKVPSCQQVVCGPPPTVEHASHDGVPGRFSFETGTELTYSCDFGYYRSGTYRAICSGLNGSWMGPKMTCKARECGDPGEIDHGRRSTGYEFIFPARVTYYCDDGFEMRGSGQRQCQANGAWSGSRPRCEPIRCPTVEPPQHGTLVGTSVTYGSKVQVVCNNSFKVVGSEERICQADQSWSGQEARCEEINCGMPGPLWNGYLDGHQTSVGSIYFFRCNTRTKLRGTGFSTTCMQDGQWSSGVPVCIGQCSIPTVANATITNAREGRWVDHGTSIEPMCRNGLVLNDTRQVICNNGTWTMVPKCVPAPCSVPPPQITDGHRVFFSLAHGSRARYFCMAGYKLVDRHRYMKCQSGQWVGTRPQCGENHCPNPGNLTNGKIHKVGNVGQFPFSHYITIIKHGERLAYECNRDFRLVGPRGAACVNGAWSPNRKPICKRSRHPLFNRLWSPFEEIKDSRKFYYRK